MFTLLLHNLIVFFNYFRDWLIRVLNLSRSITVLQFIGSDQTTFLLMLCHVPFGDIELLAVRTLKRFDASMLSKVHLKIASCIVFLGAPLNLADELILILMCSFVIPQNPLLPELARAPWIRAYETCCPRLIMGCHVIGQVLRHLE